MEFREELLRVVEPTRAEMDCLAIHKFESLREPSGFAIHAEWVDEAVFELHLQWPHTVLSRSCGEVVDPSDAGV